MGKSAIYLTFSYERRVGFSGSLPRIGGGYLKLYPSRNLAAAWPDGGLIEADGVAHFAAHGIGADAADDLQGAVDLPDQLHGLVGAGYAVFVAQIELVGDALAEGDDLFGGVELAGLGVAGTAGGHAEVVEEADFVVDVAGQEGAGGGGHGGFVAFVAAAGAAEDEPGEFVFVAHRLVGYQAHARVVEAAEHFHAGAHGGVFAGGAQVEVG